MRDRRRLGSFLLLVWLILPFTSGASADVAPGEIIDKTNWEKAEGLLPEAVLAWVKEGQFVLPIGELNLDPAEYFPPFTMSAFETNAGRYDLDENDGIILRKSGEPASLIVGLPFPGIDPEDPKATQKIMHNHQYMQYIYGNFRFKFQLLWIGGSGYEREVHAEALQAPMTGYPGAEEVRNPDSIEKYMIIVVRRPFDLAGTAAMTWRFLSPTKRDNSFGYAPAIRRVRRMSAANRSDSFLGTDQCMDDGGGYDGKVTDFTWKLLRQEEIIRPFSDADPSALKKNPLEEWVTQKDVKPVAYGYEKEGWQGAPWAPTNILWVKRPAYVIEMNPKDKYYNYGIHYLWVDTVTFSTIYKVIYDRSGKYWKASYIINSFCGSPDEKMRFMGTASQTVVDERQKHATITYNLSPKNIWHTFAELEMKDFTLGGFQKFCK